MLKIKDPLEFVHEILTHPELLREQSVQEWLEIRENKRLYDHCRLYIEAGLRKDGRFTEAPQPAFRDFKGRIILRDRRKRIVWWSVAASVLLVAGLSGWLFRTGAGDEEIGKVCVRMETPPFSPGRMYAVLVTESGKNVVLDGQKTGPVQIDGEVELVYDSLKQMRYVLGEKKEVHHHVLQVPQGGEYRLMLGDGTVVWLNSGSELRYPTVFGDSVREVELKGEGYFSVVRNPEVPFIVSAPGLRTKVYGTEFNVRSYAGEEVNVTLVKGLISVADKDTGEECLLRPGENACFDGEQLKVSRIDVRCFTAWREGSFYYKNQRLESIMNDLQRWYNFKTVYADKVLKDLRFELWVDRDSDIHTIIDLLTATNKIRIKRNTEEIVISDIGDN